MNAFYLGECILNLTHVPLGAKSAKKCKANIVLDAKHPSISLFANRRLAGMNNCFFFPWNCLQFCFEYLGFWPMIAPTANGEIRDKALLGVS